MFEYLSLPKPDKILTQMTLFEDNPRADKMNLGVGVYMDAQGKTTTPGAVKLAERRLLDLDDSKDYVGLAGNLAYNQAMQEIVFGDTAPEGRIHGMQAPGGSGALSVLAELIARMRPNAKLWFSTPTWSNHAALLSTANFKISEYPYFNPETCSVDFGAMTAKLRTLGPDDVVILHGCCHNPTGANLSNQQWDEVADIVKETGFLPFFDIAYQGFGYGLDEDAYSVRKFALTVDEMLVAVSCSKNFGIYRDRVGCAFVMGVCAETTDIAYANIQNIARGLYSMPPDHGASVVSTIWHDKKLRALWESELKSMSERIASLRSQLAASFAKRSGGNKFNYIGVNRGMFSLLGLTTAQVDKLREDYGIYMTSDSRINVAGVQEENIDRLVEAVLAVSM